MPDPSDHDILVRMEGKVDTLVAGSTDHEQRIRSLERWRYLATGAAAAIGAACGSASGVIVALIGH